MTCFRSRRAVLVDLCKDGCWSITTVLLRSFPIAVVPDEKSFKIAIGKEWVFFWTALPPAQTNIDVLGGSSVLLCNPAAIISPQICSYFGVKAVSCFFQCIYKMLYLFFFACCLSFFLVVLTIASYSSSLLSPNSYSFLFVLGVTVVLFFSPFHHETTLSQATFLGYLLYFSPWSHLLLDHWKCVCKFASYSVNDD